VAPKILISAGEASGDFYATGVLEALRQLRPGIDFFGCAQPRMLAAGVRPVMDASKLSVVGLVEVLRHLPGIYGEYRRLIAAARAEKPALAILTDSSGFHLRVARQLKRLGIRVVYLVAPQAWAWREGRVKAMRRDLTRLLCIFPFEEAWFRDRGVPAQFIGHPMARHIHPTTTRAEFFARHGLDPQLPLIALLPGSRRGEITRHLTPVASAVELLHAALPAIGRKFFANQSFPASIHVIEGQTWDLLAHCDVALAASGTVTMEAALLGAPVVSFYRVSNLSWRLGRHLVRVPFFTMVNLVAGRAVVPELIQDDCTGPKLARAALGLLTDAAGRDDMKNGLAQVAQALRSGEDPFVAAARIVDELLNEA
jgi:lipid-A-disaccharide synthase